MSLTDAINAARIEWERQHGRCSMCATGDRPLGGLHGSHACGNATGCTICHGCLPVSEQCQACYRIAQE